MDLKRLRVFVAVVEAGGFSAASRALNMAQPAVSIAIRKLEEELGVTLFDAGTRRRSLTHEGEHLLEHATKVLAQVDLLEGELQSLRGMLSGQLSIACPSMLATYFLPELLSKFMLIHPQLPADISQYGTQDIEQKLRAHEIDLGVIVGDYDQDDADLECVPLVDERLCLAVSESHEWANRAFVRYEALDRVPMFIYQSGYFIREAFMNECARASVQPDLKVQANFLPLLIQMARDGGGVTLGLQLMKEQERGIQLVPLVPATRLTLLLAKPRERSMSIANQAFFDWLCAEFE